MSGSQSLSKKKKKTPRSDGSWNIFFCDLIRYTPSISLCSIIFSYTILLPKNLRQTAHFLNFLTFVYSQRSAEILYYTAWRAFTLSPLWECKTFFFNNFGDLWSLVDKNEQNFAYFTKIDIFHNIAPKYMSMKMVIITNVLPSSSSFECNFG